MSVLLFDKEVQLEKFPGKGGWTFARVPEVIPNKNNPFGWRAVKGFIDDFEIKFYKLMPMGNGHLFLPVKAEIRKKIRKQEGDWVKVTLFDDEGPAAVPEEFLNCLSDDPSAFKNFERFNEKEKMKYIHWIYNTKSEDQKIERMAVAINRIAAGEYFTSEFKY